MSASILGKFQVGLWAWIKENTIMASALAYVLSIFIFAAFGADHIASTMLFVGSLFMIYAVFKVTKDDRSEIAAVAVCFSFLSFGLIAFFSHWIVTAPWPHYFAALFRWIAGCVVELVHYAVVFGKYFVRHGING